ncbi:MAG: patatin-like phospholipase family protein [Kiloniellales bacterium]
MLRALSDLNIRPDVICGTSIGALIGGFYLTGHLDALEDWARRLTKLRMIRYMDPGLRRNGLISGNRLFNEMERYLGDIRIEDLPIPFATVATDLLTGHEIWLTQGRLIDAVRASFSLPGLFEPVQIDGRWAIDGAIVNPVPISVCHALGARVIIAINLNCSPPRRNGTHGKQQSKTSGFDPLPRWTGTVFRRNGRNGDAADKPKAQDSTPSLLNVLASTLNIVQDRVTRSRLAAEPPDLNIIPRLSDVGMLDFHRAKEAMRAGEAAIRQAEPEIREAMTMFEAAG